MSHPTSTLRFIAAASLFLALAPLAHAVPSTVSVQGHLTNDAGVARDGTYALTVSLWTAETGGVAIFSQTDADVAVSGGLFDLVLGADPLAPLTPAIFRDHSQVWLQFEVDAGPGVAPSEAPLPRQPLTATPFAFAAHHALTADTATTASGLACATGCVAISELEFDPATQSELDAALANVVTPSALNAALAPYARTADLSAYVTLTRLATELGGLVTRSELATALAGYVTTANLASTLEGYARKTDLPTRVDGLGGGTLTSGVSAPSFTQAGQPVCDASGNCGRTVDDFTCADGEALVKSAGQWVCTPLAAAPPTCAGPFQALRYEGGRWTCTDLRASGLSRGKARGFELIDAWGYAWDGQMRQLSTWANASASCVADGGRLPTITELSRVNQATGLGGVGDGLETDPHWSITPFEAGARYVTVRLDNGVVNWSGNAATVERYRCVWPNHTSTAFNGNECYGPPGAECFASTAEGGRYNADKYHRPAVPWWVAVNECAFYNARVARAVTYLELIQAGLPNGPGGSTWLWTSDRGGFNSENFLFTTLRWTGTEPAATTTHTVNVNWEYNTAGYPSAFRCVGLKDELGPYAGTVANEFVDVGRTWLKSTTTESALQTWVMTLDSCAASGGHIPSLADWTALIQSGLPRPDNNEHSHTSDAEVGSSGGSTDQNAIVRWTLTDPAFSAGWSTYSTRGSRGANHRGRCVWYPLDPTYTGPTDGSCNGGCFRKTVRAHGQTHDFWADSFDRTPAKLSDAIRTCYQRGGHLMSHAEYAELIRAGLPNGSNVSVWTSDWARYDQAFTVKWLATALGWDNLANSAMASTAATTTAPYRCLWSNELNE